MLGRLVLSAGLALSIFAAPALAGDAAMTRAGDGMELTINCKGSGCTVRGKQAGGNWGTVETGPGGRKNFEKLVARYKAMGFS